MNILVTGANGFIGRNLVAELENRGYKNIFKFTRESEYTLLKEFTNECDFVFHLAGINRPKEEKEFWEGNVNFTSQLLNLLKKYNNDAPILITSSVQAELDNPYGKSKKDAENLVLEFQKEMNSKYYIYRLPNVFGKWSKPNYNTVVATFCHHIARDIEIQVNNPQTELTLTYIDDVINEFINALEGNPSVKKSYCFIPVTYKIKLGELVELIKSFKKSRINLTVPNMDDPLAKKLYSTYLSFLPKSDFSYKLQMNIDKRGSFTEFIKTTDRGQVSVNISKPGITKGEHWHHTKNEKFLVVSGDGVIRLRKIDSQGIIEYFVNGNNLEVIDIPPGYTHNIENLGETDMVTVMWANEKFNPNHPDTYYLEVER